MHGEARYTLMSRELVTEYVEDRRTPCRGLRGESRDSPSSDDPSSGERNDPSSALSCLAVRSLIPDAAVSRVSGHSLGAADTTA